jgi:hypothetical protein
MVVFDIANGIVTVEMSFMVILTLENIQNMNSVTLLSSPFNPLLNIFKVQVSKSS